MRNGTKLLVASALAVLTAGCAQVAADGTCEPGALEPRDPASESALTAPAYDDAFWQHWSDGNAELASYSLRIPRYGAVREGKAVAIYVKEPFRPDTRVKADAPSATSYEAMKLNLVMDFQTGVYDYNTMTSVFLALEDGERATRGLPAKVSYSAQEWCGHVYHHVLFDRGSSREILHSYFDGEADQSQHLDEPTDALSEDALLMWARGMAAPAVAPGASTTVSLLDGLQRVRFAHKPMEYAEATLSVAADVETVSVPGGEFEVRRRTAAVGEDRTWTFYVEEAWPHRVIRWTRDDGFDAQLVGTDRMPYWRLHDEGDEANLERIGL